MFSYICCWVGHIYSRIMHYWYVLINKKEFSCLCVSVRCDMSEWSGSSLYSCLLFFLLSDRRGTPTLCFKQTLAFLLELLFIILIILLYVMWKGCCTNLYDCYACWIVVEFVFFLIDCIRLFKEFVNVCGACVVHYIWPNKQNFWLYKLIHIMAMSLTLVTSSYDTITRRQ